MIELTSYPDNEVLLYIDFGYKGIPQDLPIDRFEIRNSPAGKIEPDLDEPKKNLITRVSTMRNYDEDHTR